MGGRLINCPAFVTRPRHDIRGLLAKLKGVPGSVLKCAGFLILFSSLLFFFLFFSSFY